MPVKVLIKFQDLLMILGLQFGGKFKYENENKTNFTSLKVFNKSNYEDIYSNI